MIRLRKIIEAGGKIMQNDRSQDSRNTQNPQNSRVRTRFGGSRENSIEKEKADSGQKDWTREDRGSTEYEKHR
jgi:hypothetical protein